jgi:hypothetical protein
MADVATEVMVGGIPGDYALASAGGDRFRPADGTFLHVKNGSAAAVTVTIATPATADGLAVENPAHSVPAGGALFIKPPPVRLVRDVDGMAAVSWSDATSVTFAVLNV